MNIRLDKALVDENIGRIAQQLQKFKQETQYACLKLGCKDWATLLTQIRIGNIIKINPQMFYQKKQPTRQANQSSLSNTNQNLPSFDTFLNDILEKNLSTKRSTGRNHYCECQSPICSQKSINHIKGSNCSSSQCSNNEPPSLSLNYIDNLVDNTSEKHQPQLLQGPTKTIPHFQYIKEQLYQETQTGFQTFRKPYNSSDANNQKQIRSKSATIKDGSDETAKKYLNQCQLIDRAQFFDHYFERVPSQEWITEPIDQNHSYGKKQFLLALENTKLRREIKILQQRIRPQ